MGSIRFNNYFLWTIRKFFKKKFVSTREEEYWGSEALHFRGSFQLFFLFTQFNPFFFDCIGTTEKKLVATRVNENIGD